MPVKQKKYIDYIMIATVALLIICSLLSCICGTFIKGGLSQKRAFAPSEGWYFADGTALTEENRVNQPWNNEGTLSVFKEVSPEDYGKALFFRNHRQDITLKAGDKILYDTYGDGSYHFPHCFNGYCMAVLPKADSPYKIELRMAPTSSDPCTVPEIMLDNPGLIESTLLRQSAPIILQSVIFLTVAILSLFICLLIYINGGHDSVILYGVAYILCQTMWAVCDSDIIDIIAINNEFTDVMGYFLIILRVTLLIAFGREFVVKERRKPLELCMLVACLFQLVQVGTYLLAICRLYDLHKAGMLLSTVILIIFSLCMLRELWHRNSFLIGFLTLGVIINTVLVFLAQIMYLSPTVAITYKKIYRPFLTANDTIMVLVLIITVVMAGIKAVKYRIKNADEMAVRATKQAKQLRAKVERDSLTGLMNHKAIMDCVDKYANGEKPFAVGFLDLDDFRSVNTLYGHLVGDQVIKFVAKSMVDAFDTLCGRHGGDEFVFIIEEIEGIEEKITGLQQVLTNDFTLPKTGEQLKVGSSIGIVIVKELPQDYNAVVKAADDLMYKAKSSGKNQFIIKEL